MAPLCSIFTPQWSQQYSANVWHVWLQPGKCACATGNAGESERVSLSIWPDTSILDMQADELLGELATLFRGFGKLPPGSIGKRTLDPTGLRLALANLDPKRFAAGRAKQSQLVFTMSGLQDVV